MTPYRDELIISTKAGYTMWDGPYGDWGSRKYLLASLDQSLRRMGLDYVDIFYHHRMDPNTPLEETMGALAQAVRSGKALYAGLSNYDGPTLEKACRHSGRAACAVRHQPEPLLHPGPHDREERPERDCRPSWARALSPSARWRRACLTDRYLQWHPG